ncbi:DUF4247 domain-containing protein [Paenibacillus chitinolyticus]|uniref:DUF4247 domain-containing protein n=1 Tax=Paenibacillus chitinolyticus TaxID=79263 RepID=UPI003671DF69
MNRWTSWISCLLVFVLLTGCAPNAGDFIRQEYNLTSADGSGSNLSKVYTAENKDVPTVAKELAAREKPREISKESQDQMFLLYPDKVINLQRDDQNPANTLVQLDSIQYAREHYSPSFLQTFLTAAMLQSVLGGGFLANRGASDYRGYRSTPTYRGTPGGYSPGTGTGTTKPPVTSEREGSFRTPGSPSGTTGGIGTGMGAGGRRSEITNPGRTKPGIGTRPGTSGRSGSFKRRR